MNHLKTNSRSVTTVYSYSYDHQNTAHATREITEVNSLHGALIFNTIEELKARLRSRFINNPVTIQIGINMGDNTISTQTKR